MATESTAGVGNVCAVLTPGKPPNKASTNINDFHCAGGYSHEVLLRKTAEKQEIVDEGELQEGRKQAPTAGDVGDRKGETRGSSQGSVVGASSASVSRAESETSGSSQGSALGASSAPVGGRCDDRFALLELPFICSEISEKSSSRCSGRTPGITCEKWWAISSRKPPANTVTLGPTAAAAVACRAAARVAVAVADTGAAGAAGAPSIAATAVAAAAAVAASDAAP